MVSVECVPEHICESGLILCVQVRIRAVTSIVDTTQLVKQTFKSCLIELIADGDDFGTSLLQVFNMRRGNVFLPVAVLGKGAFYWLGNDSPDRSLVVDTAPVFSIKAVALKYGIFRACYCNIILG